MEKKNVNMHHPTVKKDFYTVFVKRMLDIFLSGLSIIVLSPVLLVLSFCEVIFHGWPILYGQKRLGLHGKEFKIHKFRSMTNEKDVHGNLLPGEQRLTSFGRFLRRFSLDELPELFCILTGKMSIIGPRPLLVKYRPYYTERHMMRHEMRPGLACPPLWSQKTWSWNDQFETDIWYIEHCSFMVDLKMIFAVTRDAITGAEYRVEDTRGEFNGENLFDDAKKKKTI